MKERFGKTKKKTKLRGEAAKKNFFRFLIWKSSRRFFNVWLRLWSSSPNRQEKLPPSLSFPLRRKRRFGGNKDEELQKAQGALLQQKLMNESASELNTKL